MKLLMFSVFDIKAGAYLPPFSLLNEEVAKRAFLQACADPNHNFNRNPEDYTLFCVGSFDDSTGVLTLEPSPRFVMTALEAKSVIQRRVETDFVRLGADTGGEAEKEDR